MLPTQRDGVSVHADWDAFGLRLAPLIVLLVEARSGLVLALTVLAIRFLSYATVAGVVDGGGIGALALRYGYCPVRAPAGQAVMHRLEAHNARDLRISS